MNIGLKDLYQFIIAELRYGYSRNNHLMPDGAFEHARYYILGMYREDKAWAIRTLTQAVSEAISEFSIREPFKDTGAVASSLYDSYVMFIMWGLDKLVQWQDVWRVERDIYNLVEFFRIMKKNNETTYLNTIIKDYGFDLEGTYGL